MALAYWDGGWSHPEAYQCNARAAPALLGWLVRENQLAGLAVRAQVEEFRAGTGAGARGLEADVTRTLVDDLAAVLKQAGVIYKVRSASEVKPWAGDKRLERAGLLAVTSKMTRDGRDAQRHLLFCAVHDYGVPDPLSKRGQS
jgi:hypothetical protein